MSEPDNDDESAVSQCMAKHEYKRRLQAALDALELIYWYADWHSDDEADENNPSPEDMAAHINGLIRKTCRKVLDQQETTTKTDRTKNAEVD